MLKEMVTAACVLMSVQAHSASLSTDSNGYQWAKASRSEKTDLVIPIKISIGGKYPVEEMMACLNAFYAPPIQKDIHRVKLADSIVMCHLSIK